MSGAYKPREPGSLKEAETALVGACGGIKRAAQLSRVEKSQMARYTDPACDDTHMPADVVRALELHCGAPHVSRFLVMAAGYVALKVPQKEDRKALMRHLGAIGRKNGQLYGDACEALADGRLSPRERAKVRGEALKTITALSALVGDLDAPEARDG